jgi:hypothetical protein
MKRAMSAVVTVMAIRADFTDPPFNVRIAFKPDVDGWF